MPVAKVGLSAMLGEGETLSATMSRSFAAHSLMLKLGEGVFVTLFCPAPDEDSETPSYLDRVFEALENVKRDMEADAADAHIAQLDKARAWPIAENE